MAPVECRICAGPTDRIFVKLVLARHRVGYHKCPRCGFLQTDEPHWSSEAYASALSSLDTALVARPLSLREPVCRLIQEHLDPGARFLDFGGGAGLFVRLMRDLGYDFYRQDKYAPNLFAQGFDLDGLAPAERRFALVTAFEVVEHVPSPVPLFEELLSRSDTLLFATELQPETSAEELARWPYLGELHGQHVSLFSARTLEFLAGKLGVHSWRCGRYLHLFARRPIRIDLDRRSSLARRLRALVDRAFRGESYWLTRRPPLTEADNARALVHARTPSAHGRGSP